MRVEEIVACSLYKEMSLLGSSDQVSMRLYCTNLEELCNKSCQTHLPV